MAGLARSPSVPTEHISSNIKNIQNEMNAAYSYEPVCIHMHIIQLHCNNQ